MRARTHDTVAVAPYFGGNIDNYSTNEELFGPLFAEPEMVNQAGGYMRRDYDNVQGSGKRVPLAVYEVNLHTTRGSIPQNVLNSFTPSVGAGVAVTDHMLMMLRDLKIRDQNLYSLTQYANGTLDPNKYVLLWGSVRDMGVTNRKRPQFLAVKLANEAIAGDLVQTTQSGDNPTWSQPLLNAVQYNNAHYLQSYAFSSGSSRSLIVFNLSRTSSLAVNFAGVNAPAGTVTLKRLTSAAITDTNEDAENVTVTSQTLSNFDANQPLSLPPFSMSVLQWQFSSPAYPFSVTDRGGMSLMTAGAAPSTSVGYSRIQPNTGSTSPSGLAIFAFRQNNVLVTEARLPATPLIQQGRIYSRVDSTINTGIAIANPSNQAATVSFFFTDSNGNNFGNGTTTINPNGQIAAFLSEPPFNGNRPILGTFTFASSAPVAAIALQGLTNERNNFLLTTLPVTDLSHTSNTAPVFFPHFARGGGRTTQAILINPTEQMLSGTVQFYGQGSPAAAATPTMDPLGYSIPARGVWRVELPSIASTTTVGSIRVIPAAGTAAPSGLAVFSFRSGGVTVSQASVSASPAGTAFRMYAEASIIAFQNGSIQTGLAVTNPSANPATVNLELTNLDGSPTGLTGTLSVPANGQVATFLNQIQGFASLQTPFQGVLRLSSSLPVSMAGLRGRYNERGDFLITTTAPINEASPPVNSPFFFPHLADSGGYTTQFILFSGLPGQSSFGMLQLFSQSGQPLSLPLR